MSPSRTCDRRAVLAMGAAALATLAGCGTRDTDGDDPAGGTDSSDGDDTPDPNDSPTATDEAMATDEATATGTAATADTTPTPELDLREANVVGVETEGGDGSYRFDVTLYHDDDGEDGYANWWQVESLTGDQLGRRTLLHAHSTAPFTRSETIDVPAGTSCVVVRGHDQTHGYGGRAVLVNVDTGRTRGIDQGTAPRTVEERDCP